MSDINLIYPSVTNSAAQRTNFGALAQTTAKENEAASTQSLFKSYFDSLRERSDGEAKKLLEDLENTPLTQISKLFTDVQTASVDNTSRLFEDLRIKPTNEMDSLFDTLRANGAAKVEQITAMAQKNKTDNTDETDKRDKIDETDDGDLTEETLAKRIKKLTEKDQIAADNNKLNDITERTIEAVQKAENSFFRSAETGEIDRGGAYGAAEDFVKSYNAFANEINGSENGTVSGKSDFVSNMTAAFRPRLERVGIDISENGELTIDEERFSKASDNELEQVFGEKDSFADFIDGQAKQLAAYAQTDLYQRSSAYSDSGNITQVSTINGTYFNMLG